MRFHLPLTLGAVALLAGCAQPAARPVGHPVSQVAAPKADAWQGVASRADIDRIARIRQAWDEGLSEARATGNRRDVEAEGALLKGDSALARPAPTPGSYECRMVRLGRTEPRGKAFEKFKPFFCYVEVDGNLLTIVKQTGSQRPAGRLWEDDNPERLIYLGSLALGSEEQPKAYGDDPKRDMAGVFERIGPFRWRLVIPWPQAQSKLDVYELTPVADQPK
ncbi:MULTISPECIES: DUF4893 domain-containing protein [Sphingomonas]|uniref:DUF4893 domain-containing protein n=1 Tax=Sphingomonas TaxID=13687 RepID=UPI0013B42CB8|nr:MULTISPECIES: DUF4893 domain-containing protein [Sphingomonas]